jgi:hypothetical protein
VIKRFDLHRVTQVLVLCFGAVTSFAQDTAYDVTGTWKVTRELGGNGREVARLELKGSGSSVSGTVAVMETNAVDIGEGKLAGESLTFSFLRGQEQFRVAGRIRTEGRIDLTVTNESTGESFQAVAERVAGQAAKQPINPFPLLPAPMTRRALTPGTKFDIYFHQAFGPPALVLPLFGAGLGMLNPRTNYPHDWRSGGQAFGKLYGDALAEATAKRTAIMLTSVLLHEDPRYRRSGSTNIGVRVFHALSSTVIDRTDSGRPTLAVANFAGAAAGGFVGMSYLPRGFNDITHAEQRAAMQFGTLAVSRLAAEFQPEWAPFVSRLHILKVLPEWWVPRH